MTATTGGTGLNGSRLASLWRGPAFLAAMSEYIAETRALADCLDDAGKHQDAETLRREVESLQREMESLKQKVGQ
jgi:hypothetical protein